MVAYRGHAGHFRFLPPDDDEWKRRAACRGQDTALFYDPATEGAAKAVCAGCEVREECLTWATRAREPEGVWGGASEDDRRRARRRVVDALRKERSQSA